MATTGLRIGQTSLSADRASWHSRPPRRCDAMRARARAASDAAVCTTPALDVRSLP